MAMGKGAKPNRLFDADTFRQKSREGAVVALRKEIITVATKAEGSTEDVPKVDFVLSTAAVDRSKDVINQDGWILDPYKANPVVLWAHDGQQPPVGRAPSVHAEKSDSGTRLVSRGTEFLQRDLADAMGKGTVNGWAVGQMYLKGFLNAVSVGFLPHTYAFNEERGGWAVDFLTQELLEFSCVPVPANPEALQGAKAAGIPIGWVVDWAEKILDTRTREDFEPAARTYVEQLRKTVAPATFAVPAQKDSADDADASADDALLEQMAALEAALVANTAASEKVCAAIEANTAAMATKAAPPVVQATAPVLVPAKPVTPEQLAALVKAAVASQLAQATGRKP